MITRRFGRTGHHSTAAIFGACALGYFSPEKADIAVKQVIDAGINHIDIAPSYGNAEEQISRWLPSIREKVFLGCKTMERKRKQADHELHQSLIRMKADYFDLYQLHAITNLDELDEATMTGGALEAIIDARQEGWVRCIGITGHGIQAPAVFLEALRRFDFDSVLFPVNFVLFNNPEYRADAEELIRICQQREVGMMGIKSITRGPWGEKEKTYNTWYEPFTRPEILQKSINFALSQGITGICTPCDVSLLPAVITACQNFREMDSQEQEDLLATADEFTPLFV